MTEVLPAGPYRVIDVPGVGTMPYFIVPFDADGGCEAPLTRQHLLANAEGYSDIFLFSHGWNNDWAAATQRYEGFIRGMQKLRLERGLQVPADYKPLLVGIFWPSQAMEWLDSEAGPGFAAGGDPAAQDRRVGADRAGLQDIAAALPVSDRGRFYALTQAEALDQPAALALAAMLAGATRPDDEGVRSDAPDAADLMAAAQAIQAEQSGGNDGRIGTVTDAGTGAEADEPSAAFGVGAAFSALDPRNLVKPFTVWHMKDRAGRVGHEGVAPLLDDLLRGSRARVHLLGHSYGCKVVMTALCAPAQLSRPVESALLLQPAMSEYAFATRVPERGVAGGFARALQRVRLPIVATYSGNDFPLRRMFHLSVRRRDDAGELQYAGAGSGPSLYCAMGGYGPQSVGASWVDILDPGSDYALAGSERVIAVNGTRCISGHGDISNPATWWLSTQLIGAHLRAV